jgi:hypothetical protein
MNNPTNPPLVIDVPLRITIRGQVSPTAEEREALAGLREFAAGFVGLPPSPDGYALLGRQIALLARTLQPYFLRATLCGLSGPRELLDYIDSQLRPLEQQAAAQEHEARRRDGNLGQRHTKLRIQLGKRQG